MYDSRTIRPRLPGRRGGGHGGESAATTNRWYKEKGRGSEIRWGTTPRVIDARFGAAKAIAEGLAELAEEAAEAAQEALDWARDCESFEFWEDTIEADILEMPESDEERDLFAWVMSPETYPCGDRFCDICN